MDGGERLAAEAAAARTALAAAHVQRYELAARLCRGLEVADVCCGSGYGSAILGRTASAVVGVDNDAQAIASAETRFGSGDLVSFRAADAVEFLANGDSERFEALVMFGGLEHLDDPDTALTLLNAHAANGRRLILSLSNNEAVGERRPLRGRSSHYACIGDIFATFTQCTVLSQFTAEGALIVGGSKEIGRLALTEQAETDYANTFIGCVNVDEREVADTVAGVYFTVAPVHNRYVLALERANIELRRTNTELANLAREGPSSSVKVKSAAAGFLARLGTAERELAAKEEGLRRSEEDREQVKADLERLTEVVYELEARLADRDAAVADRDAAIAERQRIIDDMTGTRIWRMGQWYWRIRNALKRVLRRGAWRRDRLS